MFTSIVFNSSFLCLLANLTYPSNYSSYHGMVRMVSISVNDILPLMKWVKIFDLITASDPTPNSLFIDKYFYGNSILVGSLVVMSKGNLLFGTLVCENKS